MTIEEWLGKENKLGIDIWEKKYRQNNESFDEWLERVSGGDKALKQLMEERKFLFGGRTLSNRGTGKKGSMSNCYSRGFLKDDLADLMQATTDIAKTFKAQGGQGLSLSNLRPKGCGINHGQFQSDGIIPFMEIYNCVTESISQGGSRKGALIMTLDAWHKEAPEFINIKSEENKIQKANLSLEIDDEFMECVQEYFKSGKCITKHITRDYDGNIIEYDVTPIEIYKLMMEKAWEWGEPGCIFTNRFRNYNLMEFSKDYQIETCNPCVTSNTRVLTDKGHYPIIDLVGKEINVWNGYKFSKVVPSLTATNQNLMKVSFSNGSTLTCTPYHKFILNNETRVECHELKIGDKLQKCALPIINGSQELDNAYTQGFFSGDGFECKDRKCKYISFYGEHKKPLADYCATINQREDSEKRTTYSVDVKYSKDFVPVNDYTVDSKVKWLAGIVDSDGGNNEDGSICITSINAEFIEKIFYMLQTLGVSATYGKCKDGGEKLFDENMGNKIYHVEDLYRISISASDVLRLNQLGFTPHRVHNVCIPNRDAKRYITVTNIEQIEETKDVYCFTENDNHSGIFNGILTAQCGEQPLPKHAACNLGSINLSEFVKNPFKDSSYFETEEFIHAVKIAIRALDDVLDENIKNHPLDEQKDMAESYRNVGLGIMGLYDMLVKLSMVYGSNESIDFVDSLMDLMFRTAFIESIELAKEKGCFPEYTDEVLKSSIVRDHFTVEELKCLGAYKYGIRNCSLLSIAPSGSIGTMLNISTGCEPAFALSYQRKTESLNNGSEKFYEVFTGIANEYKKRFKGISLPDYFVIASDLNWKQRIDIQSVLQKHVDTAISSTVNLKNNITIDEIEKLYLYAWKMGLKGVTIFRDGCRRAGILTTSKKNDLEEKKLPALLQRGMIVKADDNCVGKKRTLQTGCGTLHCEAFFDPDSGDLLETYLSKGSSGGCNNYMIGLSRLISLSARGGIDIYSIVDQLLSSGTCPSYAVRRATKHDTSKGSCCPVAIGNALLEMYKEIQDELTADEKICIGSNEECKVDRSKESKTNVKCPECGSPLIFEGGCNICKNCGWSKCD